MSPRASSTAASVVPHGVRTRVPRLAHATLDRARLAVVPTRVVGRTHAGRTPFAVLVIGLLVAGVVGLLMFNTHMQQTSFAATALQQRADALTAQQQSLSLELDALRQPQRVAEAAQELGMVAPAQPAFVRLADGVVLGDPAAATGDGSLQLRPAPIGKPEELQRQVRTIVVDPTTGEPLPDDAPGSDGPASAVPGD